MSDPEDERPRAATHRARPRPAPARAPSEPAGPAERADTSEPSGPADESEPAEPVKPAEPEVFAEPVSHRPGLLRRWAASGSFGSRRAGLVAAIAGIAAALVAVALVVVLINRDESMTSGATGASDDPRAELIHSARSQAFVAGATSDIQSVTSYSYRTLQSDLYNGEAVTTGAYRRRFRAALTGPLGATARRLHRTQTFQLSTAGIGAMSDDGSSAHVLLFGTQSVQDDTTGGRTNDSLVTLDATIRRDGDSYRISGLEVDGNAGLPPGTGGLTAAAEAARSEVAAVLTTRRAHLAADQRVALTQAVDPLRAQLVAQAASVRNAITTGAYDLTGEVTAVAVQSAGGDTATLMIAATGDKTTPAGTSVVATDGRYLVTVVLIQGHWLVSTLDPIAVQ